MKTKTDYKSILIEINILTIAIAIIAVAVYFFLVPSHTSISSMSGLGIVLSLCLYGNLFAFEHAPKQYCHNRTSE